MANILRREKKDYGGEEIFVEGDDTPVYAAPHIKATDAWLDGVIAQRVAGRVAAVKIAAVDNALQTEFDKRKADVDYDKTGEDAVATVFTVKELEVSK